MIFLREGIREKIREKKRKSIPIKKEGFRELLLSPRINNPADETFP